MIKIKKDKLLPDTPSCDDCQGNPETAFEMINKFGTYETGATADTENEFPKIAQGLPKKEQKKRP